MVNSCPIQLQTTKQYLYNFIEEESHQLLRGLIAVKFNVLDTDYFKVYNVDLTYANHGKIKSELVSKNLMKVKINWMTVQFNGKHYQGKVEGRKHY